MTTFEDMEDRRNLVDGLVYEEKTGRGDLCAACGFDLVAEGEDFCEDCAREISYEEDEAA